MIQMIVDSLSGLNKLIVKVFLIAGSFSFFFVCPIRSRADEFNYEKCFMISELIKQRNLSFDRESVAHRERWNHLEQIGKGDNEKRLMQAQELITTYKDDMKRLRKDYFYRYDCP